MSAAGDGAGAKPSRSICFVAHNALAALVGRNRQHAGGIERQQTTMALWLAARGWDVSMVVWDDKSEKTTEVDGVKIIRMCTPDDGLPVLRFFHPRWTSLLGALTQADSDIYYYNCGDLALGQLVGWARRNGKAVIFSVPSDPDCDPELPALHNMRERVLYRYGLKHCEHIIVQSEKQRGMLQKGFGKSSKLLRMPCAGFSESIEKHAAQPGQDFTVLWVGRISPEKRPDWVLELAKRLPDIRFRIIGAQNRDSEYAAHLLAGKSALSNVEFIGRIPHEDMGHYYASADVLCCTSLYEGFPNVFLEAWSTQTPVLTTCDPDGLVASEGLGFSADSLDGLASALRELQSNKTLHRNMSLAAREYFERNHQLDNAMGAFEAYFNDVHNRSYGGKNDG